MTRRGKADLAIIGAGWYGLMVAKTYLQLHPLAYVVILDSAATVGGVWALERLYPGLKTNNMLGTYEYPDFPMDEATFGVKPGEFIPGAVVHDYLEKFARKFDIYPCIRFDTKVDSVEKNEEGYLLRFANGDGPGTLLTGKLVLATGNTSEPFMPAIEGSDDFGAPIFHVKRLHQERDVVANSRTAVVLGGTKSAWDAAYAFAVAGGDAEVHMVIRESGHGPVWMSPPYVTPLKRWLEKLTNTRLLTFFSPCVWGFHDGYTKVRSFLHGSSVGRKIVDTFWGIIGNDVVTLNAFDKHPETAKLKPWSNPMFIGSGLSILNYDTDFFDLVRAGKIKVHIADITSLGHQTVYLSNGERLHADALVCSTGWKHHPSLRFLPGGSDAEYGLPHFSTSTKPLVERADVEILSTFPRLRDQPVQNAKYSEPIAARSDTNAPSKLNCPYNLYKFMIPPSMIRARNLGFAGVPMHIQTSTVATVQALWLCAYFDGKLKLPPDNDEIAYESTLHSRFGKWRYPAGHGAQFPDFVFDALPYVDMLLQQLGIDSHRKNGMVSEVFEAYGPDDYKDLVGEWKSNNAVRAWETRILCNVHETDAEEELLQS